MVIVIVVIAAVVTVVVIIAALIKKCHGKFTITAVPTTANQAYGLNIYHNEGVEETIYNDLGPKVDVDNPIEAKENEAYVTNTDVILEGNQAYATNVTTEQNIAYKPVITGEIVDEYDYVYSN